MCAIIWPIQAIADDNIAVIELYTTEFTCEGAPEANQSFEKHIAGDHANLIAFSCHLTEYNDDEEQSEIAREFCDERLDQYQDSLDIFFVSEPLIVFNGVYSLDGRKESGVRNAISFAHSQDSIRQITISNHKEKLHVTLPKMRLENSVDVWIFGYKKSITPNVTDISPNPQTFSNVATHAKHLSSWDGQYMNLSYPTHDIDADGYIVIAQNSISGQIIAAGKIDP